MARRSANRSYSEALQGEPKRSPLPSPSRPQKAEYVFTAEDDEIRENIRYRIYDFCFDIVYDEVLKPSIMQYIRVLYLPPNPLFDREHWEKTMVRGHWSHEPRGLALLPVCKSIYREAYFRFYWFHLPNCVLPHSDIPDLRRRLRKIPEPHNRNVNAQLNFHERWADQQETGSSDTIFVSPAMIFDLFHTMGLNKDNPRAPWATHNNVDGKRERLILGVGFHIIEESRYHSRSLTFVGKLGNMVFRRAPNGHFRGLDFETSTNTNPKKWEVKGVYDVFCHIHHHLANAARAIRAANAHLLTLRTQSSETSREEQHASENDPQGNPNLASGDTGHVSEATGHPPPTASPGHGQSLSPWPPHDCKGRFGQLRGGDFLALLHELNLHTLDLIDSLENSDVLSTSSLRRDEELLIQEVTRYSTHNLELITMEEVLRAHREESELGILYINRPKPGSDMGEECGNPTASETSKQEDGLKNSKKISKDPTETHTQSPVQTMRLLQLDEGSPSDRGSAKVESTHGHPTTHHTRQPSFETRIAQWMTRENDPMSSRKSSTAWSNGKEAYELSSRKRVTSSSYHTSLSRRSLSNKHSPSSSAGVHSTATPSSRSPSPKCSTLAVADTLAPQTSIADGANASAEPPAAASPSTPSHQAESSDPLEATPAPSTADQATTSSPPPRELPLPETTNAQITSATADDVATATTDTISPPPASPRASSRQVSLSSNAASLCVGGNRRAEDEPIVVVPGAEQFLTPKRDVKPWWETGGGSQSTGGKKRKKGREREARGSANSWISLEGGGGGFW